MFSHNWPGKDDASRRLLKVSTQEATPDRGWNCSSSTHRIHADTVVTWSTPQCTNFNVLKTPSDSLK